MPKHEVQITKLITGIEGFDLVSKGGLPLGRTTMVGWIFRKRENGLCRSIFGGRHTKIKGIGCLCNI